MTSSALPKGGAAPDRLVRWVMFAALSCAEFPPPCDRAVSQPHQHPGRDSRHGRMLLASGPFKIRSSGCSASAITTPAILASG